MVSFQFHNCKFPLIDRLDSGRGICHTNAFAYVPSRPNRGIGGLVLSAAAAAYVRIAVRGVEAVWRTAAARAGRAIREDIIL